MKNTYEVGEIDIRPWGQYKVVDTGVNFCVKRITVNPGEKLSLQRHQHRAEHWVVVSGVGTVTLGDKIMEVYEDQSLYISAKEWHRIENRSDEPLVFVEVQTGEDLNENDIERKNDKYNRLKSI